MSVFVNAFNQPLTIQLDALQKALKYNVQLYSLLQTCETINIPDYYISAGCIAQSVWNWQDGNDPMFGISDIDFVYYDPDLSYEAEDLTLKRVRSALSESTVPVDVKNEARVHLWYAEHFGKDIEPYDSCESAINTFPATATAIGVRLKGRELDVYAPFGLNDLFGRIVRPNKTLIPKEVYEAKIAKWAAKWQRLTIIPW
jgi:hypothetical protein